MNMHTVSAKKQEITRKTWEYLLRTGLAEASIGELCRETKLSQSSLYHWFVNKDDIWITAGKYGLSNVVDALMAYTLEHTDNIKEYFETLLDEVEKYKLELRIAVQITTSPVYGEQMRDKSKDFHLFYENFAHKLMELFNISFLEAETFIYSILAYVLDFAVWDDRFKTQMLLDNLYGRIEKRLSLSTETNQNQTEGKI